MHRTVTMLAVLLAALLVGAPAAAADNGLTVLVAPPASNGQMRLQVEVTDPTLQQELRSSGASPDRFRVAVDQAGAQVKAVARMADSPKERRYTVLAFDQSKSFSTYWPQAFELAEAYADELGARSRNHTVAVMTFGKSKSTHCEETTAAGLRTCLARVEARGTDQLVTRLKFYIQQAVREAARELPLQRGGSREVIVFTDAGEESAALKVKDLAREARERGVRIHVVVFSGQSAGKGIAQRLDEMSQLAEGSGGRYIQEGDVDARQAVTGLVGALEHLYWLDVAFCGVKPGQTSDRLSVEALVGQTPTAWSDPISFRQRAEGPVTAACPGTVVMGPSQAQSGTSARPGTSGSANPPGATPGTGSPTQPGTAAGSPGTATQPGGTPGTPGTATQPGGGPGAPGMAGSPGAPGADAASSGLPWWLIALLFALGLLLLIALIVLLARRRPEQTAAPVEKPSPPVAAQPAAPPPAAEPPPAQPEPSPAAPAVWKDPFATLPETRLVVSKGPPGLEPFYRVHKSTFTIGARQGEMDLTVNLPQLSGHHATVQLFKAGNVFVKDEHSTNGTFVDGRRLNPGERVQVLPGQIIRLSQHLELKLVQPGLQPAEPSAQVPIAAAPPTAPAAAAPSSEAPRTKARTIYAPARGDDE
ncbi:pSer/pThr/pTyr-binding forkhead associated (FHA) protein [Archangium gephyra]|uniref:Basic proline-rich protein n=1 Tax=Archangium gephyra TaxID=48 RepID=A0AAC8TH91_9BACT|nr:FHA domain-containing protein [Archangium gephyra]AKJ05908.1 Basic proline-rich protein precursor [Archangium gephyra]REG27337.1 pSer/pThr/pTyr-binding forkhead associated (FHA) protein [Archangium gephyra]